MPYWPKRGLFMKSKKITSLLSVCALTIAAIGFTSANAIAEEASSFKQATAQFVGTYLSAPCEQYANGAAIKISFSDSSLVGSGKFSPAIVIDSTDIVSGKPGRLLIREPDISASAYSITKVEEHELSLIEGGCNNSAAIPLCYTDLFLGLKTNSTNSITFSFFQGHSPSEALVGLQKTKCSLSRIY
jgi:hypothetical protein